jgi:hypothetical protein
MKDRGQKTEGRGRLTEVFEFGIGNAEFGKKKRRQIAEVIEFGIRKEKRGQMIENRGQKSE